ncbi:N-formylglutamate amidohydrolase [Sphingomonas sp. 1P06PA]|uniref:N-formylglutamate amidohydrolase n=1 Tax=Sphingomonas sp. 1P06PA TaxID=554121 RepID=UPI0039A68B6A
MSEAFTLIPGDDGSGLLIVADHASAHVPVGIDLGIPLALLGEHVAIDIGVAGLAAALTEQLGCPAILGGVSRLVIDLNREEDSPGLIPAASDGHPIPGNAAIDRSERDARIDCFWRPYHARISALMQAAPPRLLISLHSFTPRLASQPDEARPWQIGILYNRDERAARIAIPLLQAADVVTGDNLPYSGKLLNATMNLHGEANGTAYLGIEVRQDLIGTPAGIAEWADRLAPIIGTTADAIAARA